MEHIGKGKNNVELKSSLISIIVPIYKVEDYLDRCISSLINQTYKNIEIILVDDGSPDGCPLMCDDWAKKDKRIVVIHKKNGGLSDARNAGIRIASGEYLLFVDSDDYIDADTCEAFIKMADKTNVDIVVGEAVQETSAGNFEMKRTDLIEGKVYKNTEFIKKAIRAREWYAPACFSLYRRNIYKENHLEYAKGLLHEDLEMQPRVFLAAKTVSYLHKYFYHYVIREDSITSTAERETNGRDLMKIFSEWKIIFDNVEDEELKRLLYGYLVKQYLHTVRTLKMTEKIDIPGISKKFIIKNGLNFKEKIKGILFSASPNLYAKI